MNKIIICFLFLILFFQYKCSECTQKEGSNLGDTDCNSLTTDNNKYCVPKEDEGCLEISCSEKTSNADEIFCSKLHSTVTGENNACILSGTACVETNKCNLVTKGATDELCKNLLIEDT